MNTRFKLNTGSTIANSDPTQGETQPNMEPYKET